MKDQTRNIETFKVGPTRINRLDFQKHQREMHEHHDNRQEQGAGRIQTKAERVAEVMKRAHEKVLRGKKRR